MKTKFFYTILIVSIAMHSFAQDTICKINGQKAIGKVTEVDASAIKYKMFNAGSEIVVIVPKSDIAYITYGNGTKEMYNMIRKPNEAVTVNTNMDAQNVKPLMPSLNPYRNIVAINCFDIFFTNLSLSYERISKSGKVSLKIPVSVGLGGKPNTNAYKSSFESLQFLENRLYSGGLELNLYPFGQTQSTFYIGVSALAGSFNYYTYDTPYPYNYNYNYSIPKKHIGSQYAGMIHLGGYIGLTGNILLGAKLGLGYKREETIFEDYTIPKVQFDLNMAYRF